MTWLVALLAIAGVGSAQSPPIADRLTLGRLVTPDTRVQVQGRLVRFALHGLIEFDTLDDLFRYIDTQAGRWTFPSPAERQRFADGLLGRGVESRVVSMTTELPLEVLLTHTLRELDAAVDAIAADDATVFEGRHWRLTGGTYRAAFRRVRERWSSSLNCWSASSSIPGRVLSNWYLIDEGIELFGATYDSTEHFWQAVKYHPDVSVADLRALLSGMQDIDWPAWLDGLATDQAFYFANAYAVEFLKRNLTRERLSWYDAELGRVAPPTTRARAAQQRIGRQPGAAPAFTASEEKLLWGDLADIFHLIVAFTAGSGRPAPPALDAVRRRLVSQRFDTVYLAGYRDGRVGFLSAEFQQLMLEIWTVKFLQHPRFRQVIRGTAGVRLDHFLNDGDSPDIPIPIYVGYLNRIREMAVEGTP